MFYDQEENENIVNSKNYIMLSETNHLNILLSFVRSISKATDPDQLLSDNKVFFLENKKSIRIINILFSVHRIYSILY